MQEAGSRRRDAGGRRRETFKELHQNIIVRILNYLENKNKFIF
jgi:hypothetical protein